MTELLAELLEDELRIRRDAVFMKTEHGIVFRGRHGAFALKGATVYNTFRELLPYLDGRTNATNLLKAFAPDRRPAIGNLVQALVERGIIHGAPPEEHDLLTPRIAEAFDPQIEFLRHYADKPVARFARFRDARVLLTGSGAAFAGAGVALLRNGLRKLRIGKGESDELLRLETERLNQLGLPCSLEVADSNVDVDLLLYCSEKPSLAEIFRHNAEAVAGRYRFLPAFIYSDGLFVGPCVDRECGSCWQCAMMRWSDNADPAVARELWRTIALQLPVQGTDPPEVLAHMLGNTAALEVFKLCAGMPEGETRSRILKQDLNTLESGICQILTHPECGLCKPRQPEDSRAPELTRWADCQGHEFGAFPAFCDEHIEQIPLRISTLRYRQQCAMGWSIEDSAGARLQALRKAIVLGCGNEPGTGVGATQEQAEQAALLSLAAYETVAGLAHETLGIRCWTPGQGSLGKTTAYLLATAGHMTPPCPRVWLSDPLPGVSAVFFSLSGETASPVQDLLIGTGFSEEAAVTSLLSEWIARAQMEQCGLRWDDAPRNDGRYRTAFLRWSERGGVPSPASQVCFADITPKDVAFTGTFRIVKAGLS